MSIKFFRIGSGAFSIFLFFFALSSAANVNDVAYWIIMCLAMPAAVVALSASIYSLVKNGRKFLANMVNQSNNAIINTAISVLGVVLSYLFDPSMLKL